MCPNSESDITAAVRTLSDGRVFIDYGPTSMVIMAKRGPEPLSALAAAAFPIIQNALGEISEALPLLRRGPYGQDIEKLRGLPRLMCEAVNAVGEPTLRPMAAVAGAVADLIADWLFANGADTVAVNNGGDVALRLGPGCSLKMGILPDFNGGISEVVQITDEDGIGGVCTSGLGGRSLTRGVARAVTVFASRCILADACATHLANSTFISSERVHTALAGELEPQSDIADLSVVTSVEQLTEQEVGLALSQLRYEAAKQYAVGNITRAAADVQGVRIWYPDGENVKS